MKQQKRSLDNRPEKVFLKREGLFSIELIAILLSIVLSCVWILSGCNNTNEEPHSYNSENDESSIINGENEKYDSENTGTGISSRVKYMSFEDTLATATDIMVATYTGRTERHGIYYDLEFIPVKQIKGTAVDGNIHVRICEQSVSVVDRDIGYVVSPSRYETGANYVLVLEKFISVYNLYDLYLPLNNILIESGEKPTMYNDSFVGDFSASRIEGKSSTEILEYIEDFQLKGEDVSQVVGYDYIRSTNLADVVSSSSVVIEIVPVELLGANENNDTERFVCNITNSLKGDMREGQITIIFVADTVDIGSKYIVMLERLGDSDYYILSSKASVYANDGAISEKVKTMIQSSSMGEKN